MSKNILYIFAFAILLGGFLVLREAKKENTGDGFSTESLTNTFRKSESPEFHKWREFTSASGKFKVLLPTLPQHANDKVVDSASGITRRYDTFVAADDKEQAFMISMITFAKPIDKSEIDALLKTTVDDMIKRNKENKLISVEPSKFHGQNALTFSLTNGQIFVSGQAFVSGNSIYVLSLLSKGSNYDSKELEFFINSFDVDKEIESTPANAK